MTWRVAIRPRSPLLEVIDPEDWANYTLEYQQTYQVVSQFSTEREAEQYARDHVDAAKAAKAAHAKLSRPPAT